MDHTLITNRTRSALSFGNQRIKLHEASNKTRRHATAAVPGTSEPCFVTTTPHQDVQTYLDSRAVASIRGPIDTVGTLGKMHSIFFRAPDKKLIEIAIYDAFTAL